MLDIMMQQAHTHGREIPIQGAHSNTIGIAVRPNHGGIFGHLVTCK